MNMKLRELYDLHNGEYTQDWQDNTYCESICIVDYTKEDEIKYNCERLQNLIIDNVEIVDSSTIKLSEFIDQHIDELNKIEGYEDMDTYSWIYEMNMLISGNVGDNLTGKVYEVLKDGINKAKRYQLVSVPFNDDVEAKFEIDDYFTRVEENEKPKLFTLEEAKGQFGEFIFKNHKTTQSWLRGNPTMKFYNDGKNVRYYRYLIFLPSGTKAIACIYDTVEKKMY